ncbi:UNVERIFIED_CONTAM: hypothetical protein Sangu_0684300 [Sesamum angustifolium]|uniref:SAM domain-containing protein n=1 Tax=Sesamum angustifolium TaxID=2727405 RepID=A0AAW2PRI9_9LAMI
MDWYSWLSKTNLELALVHEYALAFVRNELQREDLTYFNHEFLQSIGISVAKHRLEILKLARKEERGRMTNGLSRLVMAMYKTKRVIAKNVMAKWGFSKNSELSPYRNQWNGALKRLNGVKQVHQNIEKGCSPCRNIMWSGPLDKRVQDKFMVANRSVSVSGPLDGKISERVVYPNRSPMVMRPVIDGRAKERLGYICRSPTVSGPIDRWGLSPKMSYYSTEKLGEYEGVQSLWSVMFQDMKPT